MGRYSSPASFVFFNVGVGVCKGKSQFQMKKKISKKLNRPIRENRTSIDYLAVRFCLIPLQ